MNKQKRGEQWTGCDDTWNLPTASYFSRAFGGRHGATPFRIVHFFYFFPACLHVTHAIVSSSGVKLASVRGILSIKNRFLFALCSLLGIALFNHFYGRQHWQNRRSAHINFSFKAGKQVCLTTSSGIIAYILCKETQEKLGVFKASVSRIPKMWAMSSDSKRERAKEKHLAVILI